MNSHEHRDVGNGWGHHIVTIETRQLRNGWRGRLDGLKWFFTGKRPVTEMSTCSISAFTKPSNPDDKVALDIKLAQVELYNDK